MSDRHKQIIEMMSKNNTISAKQLASALNVSSRTIERDIEKMTALKIIERKGADRGGFWKIIEN
ncbi:MAG: HTH domain-containing protein [Tannerella sp.]|nr:HTH domain-containing protein [Tannerella sp.]